MKAIVTLLTAALFIALLSAPAAASFEKAETKFNRGMANIVAFWVEIPYQLFEGVKANPLTGLPIGIGKTLYMVPARIASGAVDVVTFPIPFPVKEYGSLVQPPYNPWITNE